MTEQKSRPFGCYDRRFVVELIPALALVATSAVLMFAVPRTPTLNRVILGLASIGTAWSFVVTIAAIRRLDELQQRVHLIAIAIGFTVTGVVAAMTKFLVRAGVPWVPGGMDLLLLMYLTWMLSVVVLNRRYR